MANEQNLIRNEDLTPTQRRENASKAGKASAAKRKQKKTLRAAAQMILEMPVSENQEKTRELMRALGVQDEDMTYAMSIVIALLSKATKGDVNAARLLRDTAGFEAGVQESGIFGEDSEDDQVLIYLPDNGRPANTTENVKRDDEDGKPEGL